MNETPTRATPTHAAITRAIRQHPEGWGLFLDIDGTLLDLALTPDAISVPPALPDQLASLADRLGGALALVTGRSLAYADSLFAPHVFPVAGLHGAEIRAEGRIVQAAPTEDFLALVEALRQEAAHHPGLLVEDKGGAVALHYRLAPELGPLMAERMRHYAERAGPDFALQAGKMVFELRPARSGKGEAVARFLEAPPFLGRRPLAIGDDLTDESMFALANARGGLSVFVGRADTLTCAALRLPRPEDVRALVAELAGPSH